MDSIDTQDLFNNDLNSIDTQQLFSFIDLTSPK